MSNAFCTLLSLPSSFSKRNVINSAYVCDTAECDVVFASIGKVELHGRPRCVWVNVYICGVPAKGRICRCRWIRRYTYYWPLEIPTMIRPLNVKGYRFPQRAVYFFVEIYPATSRRYPELLISVCWLNIGIRGEFTKCTKELSVCWIAILYSYNRRRQKVLPRQCTRHFCDSNTCPDVLGGELCLVSGGEPASSSHEAFSHRAHPHTLCARCYSGSGAAPPHYHFLPLPFCLLLSFCQRHVVYVRSCPPTGYFDVVFARRG